jgi:LuxR family maltose regulon positive regulatory protein
MVIGEIAAARTCLEAVPAPPRTRFEADSHDMSMGLHALIAGDLPEAVRRLDAARQGAVALGYGAGEMGASLFLSRALFELGRTAEAMTTIERTTALAEASGSPLHQYWCLIMRAHFAAQMQDGARVLALLRSIFTIGRAHGYFGEPGIPAPAWAALCARALAAGIEVAHVHEVIDRNALSAPEAETEDLDAWPWPVHVTTLARFEVVTRHPSAERSRKVAHVPLRLLKALVAFGGRDVTEAALTDALWPLADGDGAARSLESALHRLRKLLGHRHAITVRAGALTLDRRVCWVDAFALEDLCKRIGRTPPAADVGHLATRLFALYRGPLLADEPHAAWADIARTRLRRSFVTAVAALASTHEVEQQEDAAAELLARALDADELCESLYPKLMSLLLRQQKPAEGLRVYERCVKALRQRIPVSPETHQLYQQLCAAAGQ